ncbi:MAG: AAA family ATPase [Bacteroidales bacterium]|nr:AAA family ATPase [Bacteroidales bacterium]
MKINTIKIKGYKSIKEQIISLNQINILIGGNGIGKSNFISAFELMKAISQESLQKYVIENGGANSILHFGKRTTNTLSIELEFTNNNYLNRYTIELKENQDNLYISKAYTSFNSYGIWHTQICDENKNEASIKNNNKGQAYYVNILLNKFEIYHFHDTSSQSPIKGYKSINDNHYLRSDGSNIAPYLYYLKLQYPQNYKLIEKTISLVTPSFKSFLLEPNRLNPETIRLEWYHTNKQDIPMGDWQLSDGTLRFICLATLLLQPEPPQTIIIDEPELGLHPQAINQLSALLQKASEKSQIIISTQSTNLVDNFEPQDIIVVNAKQSASEYSRLNKEDLDKWLEEYSLGEIWEMNIIGGQPI